MKKIGQIVAYTGSMESHARKMQGLPRAPARHDPLSNFAAGGIADVVDDTGQGIADDLVDQQPARIPYGGPVLPIAPMVFDSEGQPTPMTSEIDGVPQWSLPQGKGAAPRAPADESSSRSSALGRIASAGWNAARAAIEPDRPLGLGPDDYRALGPVGGTAMDVVAAPIDLATRAAGAIGGGASAALGQAMDEAGVDPSLQGDINLFAQVAPMEGAGAVPASVAVSRSLAVASPFEQAMEHLSDVPSGDRINALELGRRVGLKGLGQARNLMNTLQDAGLAAFDGSSWRKADPLGATEVDSPEFRAWFGDSKVIDANGAPLRVFHGTGADISRFRSGPEMGIPETGEGLYFSPEPRVANAYADLQNTGDAPNLLPVYLKIENPKIVSDRASMFLTKRDVRELRQSGYDGIVNPAFGEITVFHPGQVKSAITNTGSYDPADPRITRARGGLVTRRRG